MSVDNEVTIDLGGQGLDPRAVSEAITHVEALIENLVDSAAILTLTDLRGGSAHVGLAVDGKSVNLLHERIEELRTDATADNGMNRAGLKALIGLSRVSRRRGVDTIALRIGQAISKIDEGLRENAELALSATSVSLGGARGTIYRYINDPAKHRRRAGLRRSDSAQSVELRFPPERSQDVRANLEKEVEVWGEIARDAVGEMLYIAVEGIEPLGVATTARAADGRGLLGGRWTDGLDPVDWVRMQRD